MKWFEIIVNTNSEGAELVSDAFFSLGCTGVKVIDKNDILDIIKNDKMWDYIDEDYLESFSDTVKVSGFVSEEELSSSMDKLKEELSFYKCYGEINVQEVDDESWYDNWKKYYSVIHANRYAIVPKWIKYDEKEGEISILMDPGMAFGTGEHESTKMCLQLMSDLDFAGKAVIDVGTGSGILGIAAIKSGAKSCYMCDIDSVAVKAAKENSALNGVTEKAEIELADLLKNKERTADIVLANLTADILIRLSEGLCEHINPGGVLVCSGIIHSRKRDVTEAFSAKGLRLAKDITMGEWNALLLEV